MTLVLILESCVKSCAPSDAITEKLMVIIGFKPCLFNKKSVAKSW